MSAANRQSGSDLVLSLFPGIDLLGRGFEMEGFSVVRGPDPIFGGDIRDFHVPAGRFNGVIGGPPCQQFSRSNRNPVTARGVDMLDQYARLVIESGCEWWLMENVAGVPDLRIAGYRVQRIDVQAVEFGLVQNRLRHFQFGCRAMRILSVKRLAVTARASQPCVLASEAKRVTRRAFADCCVLQGLPADFNLPGFTLEAAYQAVGNGVPVPMARAFASAIAHDSCVSPSRLREVCTCGCGRLLKGKQLQATAACRKRQQRRRDHSGIVPHVAPIQPDFL